MEQRQPPIYHSCLQLSRLVFSITRHFPKKANYEEGAELRRASVEATGATKTSLWYGTDVFNLSVEEAIRMLNEIEVYACKCYDVTAAHKAAVQELATVQELLGYDYRTGYPDKLEFKTTQL